ncbi:hypothetical protein CC86DRAFT_401523 [Ophiobolus disseminans]|uniref:Uncharacterized protein n=1 Tax=Ophiobolus disseminans TaxID=1469910 RepID=A0A6A7AE11_9PLEO|nr:hypothetical protein CC86DRAFT_401523 [Ophiobolus disseminans]
MPLPNSPDTPPITPRSSNRALSGVTIVRGLYDTAINEYNLLNTRLRGRIQDYEIALLRMQLKEKDKELQAILQTRNGTQPEKVTTDLKLMVEREEKEERTLKLLARQEEEIKELRTRVAAWERHTMKAKDMLERTYWDLSRVPDTGEDVKRVSEDCRSVRFAC